MDELARFNQERWNELAARGIEYSRPALKLDQAAARRMVDREAVLGSVEYKKVLCLSAGGGQQSAAFGLLGAEVTVLDLSPVQLERDRLSAQHYGLEVVLEQGDMRDLSRFGQCAFDIVWHAHSLNFVPDATDVFRQVARVLQPHGLYWMECTNPFIHGSYEESWTGQGYLLASPYADGEVLEQDPFWDVEDQDGRIQRVRGPREFRHTLGTIVNGLISAGFEIRGLWEDTRGDQHATPGSWAHFKTVGAPWLMLLARRQAA